VSDDTTTRRCVAQESSSPSTSYPAPVEVEGFITAAEAAHLIRLAAPLLQPSKLNAAGAVGASTNTATRRSLSAELPHAALTDDPVLRAVGLRVAEFSGTTVEQQEPLQVRRVAPCPAVVSPRSPPPHPAAVQ
jgi:hypothetical protein